MPLALMYHDIVEADQPDASGFGGPAAGSYKIAPADFAVQLARLAAVLKQPPVASEQPSQLDQPKSVQLTFDDGGVSGYSPVAQMLERFGWRGYFFIPTDQIGTPGFMDRGQLRSLRERGHIIGSHSCSHPIPMWRLDESALLQEWGRSKTVLEDILGEPITTASVPGGFYSRDVARAAAQVGIRVLFTSEPTDRTHRIEGCLILGRYAIRPSMPPESVSAIAAGCRAPRLRLAFSWKVKKFAKTVAGTAYLRVRKRLLEGT